jgi:hypothetical protein
MDGLDQGLVCAVSALQVESNDSADNQALHFLNGKRFSSITHCGSRYSPRQLSQVPADKRPPDLLKHPGQGQGYRVCGFVAAIVKAYEMRQYKTGQGKHHSSK